MLQRVVKQAVTHQSWQKDSVRTIIAELRENHPKADEQRLIKLFAEKMKDDDILLNAAAEYLVMLAINSLERAKASQRFAEPAYRNTREEKIKEIIAVGKETILFLNMEMPNGKRMRWCTGAEMQKFGGAFTKIGKRVGSTKTVGQVLDEKQVRQIIG
jgi:SepF-like predicted cell division protein (DUF552 family)